MPPRKTRRRRQRGGNNNQLYTASENGNVELVKKLLEQGDDVNKVNNNGETPLYIASRNGHIEVVKILLAAGADINKANNNGATPLLIASQNGHIEVVKVLLKAGADINKANNKGKSPIDVASLLSSLLVLGYDDILTLLKTYKIYKNIENIGEKNIEKNSKSNVLLDDITNGKNMVNFHGEYDYGRYYTKNSFNGLKVKGKRKENPITRKLIEPENVVKYKAKLVGGRRKTQRRRRRN
jgi:hypothetical protein